MNFNLKKISAVEANKFYSQYEHLGNCGLGVWHFGLLFNEVLLSIVSYGIPCFSSKRGFIGEIASKYGIKIYQLCRGATKTNSFNNIPSQTVSKSLYEIRKQRGDSLVIAYSDTFYNEIGTIYQATNALYLGLTNPKGQSNYWINGKKYSGWIIRKRFGTRDMNLLKKNIFRIKKEPLKPKHRYLFINTNKFLKVKIYNDFIPFIKDYPKRDLLAIGSMKEIFPYNNDNIYKT